MIPQDFREPPSSLMIPFKHKPLHNYLALSQLFTYFISSLLIPILSSAISKIQWSTTLDALLKSKQI